MVMTTGQKSAVKDINKKKFEKFAPKRLVGAIHMWIQSKNKKGKLAVFEITSDKQLQDHVTNVAEALELDASSTAFKSAVGKLKSADPFKEASGKFGTVPTEIVKTICEQYNIKRDVIVAALSIMGGEGKSGVKLLQGKPKYEAELKLMAMGGERVYAAKPTGTKYLFDTIAKHM